LVLFFLSALQNEKGAVTRQMETPTRKGTLFNPSNVTGCSYDGQENGRAKGSSAFDVAGFPRLGWKASCEPAGAGTSKLFFDKPARRKVKAKSPQLS
jgi:hypothetical protein